MRALVTGGAGFIGSHVVEALLARGDDVHVVDDLSNGKRENVPAGATLHVPRHPRAARRARAARRTREAIVHLAAQADVRVSVADPRSTPRSTCVGTVNVLEAARHVGARVVFASTGGAIYGECARPAREDDPCLPLSPYGAAKLAGEGYLGAFARLYGTPHVALRFGNVYGPRQDPHGEAGVVAIFLGRLLEGEPCRIFGDGSQSRDYVYVGDVARATLAALDSASGGVVNVGTGIATSVLELYEVCRSVAGSDAEPVHEPARPGELGRSVLDSELAAASIGFRPETALATGVAATWASLRALEDREGRSRARRANVIPWTFPSARRPAVRPWRTAALVAAAVAAVELLLLVVVGGALIAKPSARRRSSGRRRPRRPPRAHKAASAEEPTARRAGRRPRAPQGQGPRAERQRPPGRGSVHRCARLAPRLPHRRRRERAALRLHPQPRHVPPGLRGRRPAARARPRHPHRRPARRDPRVQLHGAQAVVVVGA